MPERPHPDMDRVREALREAEDREETQPEPPEPEPEEAPDDGDP